jgi:hypothetical protein
MAIQTSQITSQQFQSLIPYASTSPSYQTHQIIRKY